ncbi:hypothetical protein FOVG_17416 [Fusarium oxysporum f. sp. pisi HDV247]|uniref:Zn(2)-C6 fungal-type domain-containing protein n=2 Tax=Fusarium oxysporum f. sp. pisi HDV247 TaxID=1080344 RepID=W9NMS0_FUSOX|nr:hypothetical protein FOVG_17416 [Fusarium oxysporum f. sp. pisi HDV247]KAH7187183.1 hypothetical protein DER44DRAFT_179092 [Fusarium oxysporum]
MEANKRKRAALACNYCRKRKRKCDGKQPVCTLCEEANDSQCEYRDTEENRNIAALEDQVTVILDRLGSLEQALYSRTPDSGSSNRQYLDEYPIDAQPHGEILASGPVLSPSYHGIPSNSSPALEWPLGPSFGPQFTPASEPNHAMSIPLDHSTTTGELLRSAPARALLGHYPVDIFLHVELERSIPESLALNPTVPATADIPTILEEDAASLVQSFFTNVHPFHPVLDEAGFHSVRKAAFGQGLQPGLESAHVLTVLALGCVSRETYSSGSDPWAPGSHFLPFAVGILLTQGLRSFGNSLLLPQSLYLAALYHSFLARPLQAWRLVHMASTEIQHYWIRKLNISQATQHEPRNQSILRLCWAIFILECDIVAEHHLPRSGIENVVENLPLPRFGTSPEPSMLRWLANISSRRLLNRIHFVLYDGLQSGPECLDSPGSSPAAQPLAASIFKMSNELNHQLHAWFELLPDVIKVGFENDHPSIDEAVLTMRFHAAGDIIHRPFLLHVCSLAPHAAVDRRIVEKAEKCLHHCRGYLQAVKHVVQTSTASLEVFLHS